MNDIKWMNNISHISLKFFYLFIQQSVLYAEHRPVGSENQQTNTLM
jgi:hypothetical protein